LKRTLNQVDKIRAARAKGGAAASKVRALKSRRPKLDNPEGLVGFTGGVILDVHQGRLGPDAARVVLYGVSIARQLLETRDIESRLEALEAALGRDQGRDQGRLRMGMVKRVSRQLANLERVLLPTLSPDLEDEARRLAVETGRNLDEIRQMALEVQADTDCLMAECVRRLGRPNWPWLIDEAVRREGQQPEVWWQAFLKKIQRREGGWL
jgi:hypothetical protein